MIFNKLLTGKFTGIPIFIAVMLLIFHLTFNVIGKFFSDILAAGIDAAVSLLSYRLLAAGAAPPLHDLVIDGVCAGVGSVLSFVPIIAVLFFFLSLLEESGYLPNVASLMDRPMMKIGLTGRCIVPLIMSFGCAVPAVMTASSMLSERERMGTIPLIPFMSCSARLPVYAMFITVFFQDHRVLAMTGIYATGIIIAVLYTLFMKPARPCSPGLLPTALSAPYRLPDIGAVLSIVWLNVKGFIKKAFTVIFMASVIIWFLRSFDTHLHLISDGSDSILAAMGKFAAPVFTPLGFGDWRASSAVLAGISAKEAVISTFAVLACAHPGASLPDMLAEIFSPAGAFSFMVFCLLYIPCIATVAAIRSCGHSLRYVAKLILIQFAIAWLASFLTYNIFIFVI